MIKLNYDLLNKIKNKNILVAVSGGVDSIVLLDILFNLIEELNINIEVAHFNHLTRNGKSTEDQIFVKNIARKYGIVFHTESYSMEIFSKENKISEEEAGRQLRQKFFEKIISQKNNKKEWLVALAHNRDDQVETILMRIIRGTGIDGLEGMKIYENNIIRPLLNYSKSEIIDYSNENNLEFKQDYTNFENLYTRNSIRNELIPFIKQKYNVKFDDAIISLSYISKNQNNFVKKKLEEERKNIILNYSQNHTSFNKNILKKYSEFEIIEILRNEIDRISNNYNFIKTHYKEILKIINSEKGVNFSVNNLIFYNSFDEFVVRNIIDDEIIVNTEMNVQFGRYKFGKYFLTITPYKLEKNSVSLNLGERIIIRKRKNGDKLFLNNTTRKLKDFLIDKKVDKYEREILPVLEYNDEIFLVSNIYNKKNGYIRQASLKFELDGGEKNE